MIVYRDQRHTCSTAALLARLQAAVSAPARETLIDFGELEAGAADALAPTLDVDHPLLCRLRRMAVLAARAFWHEHRQTGAADAWSRKFRSELFQLHSVPLPETITASVPEGFAYYSLYPESYVEAAAAFFAERGPECVVVIGIRSIGATLSAAVAGALEELGCEVHTWTVRPRGHPYHRRLDASGELESRWRQLAHAHFAVADEGPGLSGSSLACVAERLAELGIPDQRIVLFPSSVPDGSNFLSATARERWRRHRKYVREHPASPPGVEVSGGAWRALAYTRPDQYPAVQTQHERRKYLRREDGSVTLLKFAGLGRYGQATLERATALAESGLTPPPLGLENGFLASRFETGEPCTGEASPELLDTMAAYLAFLKRRFPMPRGVSTDELLAIIEVNTAEGLGSAFAARLGFLDQARSIAGEAQPVALDGRMLPHEWIATGCGYRKTDATDHHNDHFFPGWQDIAWDIAAAVVEFALEPPAQMYLLSRYEAAAGDRGVHFRLGFYTVAYLAYRLGYSTLAVQALGDSPDARRFERLRERYAALLRREIGRHG